MCPSHADCSGGPLAGRLAGALTDTVAGGLAVAIFFFSFAVLFVVLGSANQRRIYWQMEAWAYRNPAAREPSDEMYGLRRAGSWLMAVVCLAIGAVAASNVESLLADADEVRAAAEEVAESQGPRPTVYSVRIALDKVNPNLRAEEITDGRIEITNRRGHHPVCVEFFGTTRDSAWTRVTAGAC